MDEIKHKLKPAGASAMTWSSTYVLLVLLILPKNNLTGLDRITGAKIESIVKWCLNVHCHIKVLCAVLRFEFLR